MKGHLFPSEIEAGFFAGHRCVHCIGISRMFKVRFPVVRRLAGEVELNYRLQCSCGKWGSVKLRIPILLYAYARTWQQLVHVDRINPLECPIRQYQIDGPHILHLVIREYAQMVQELPRDPSAEAGDVDRLLLGFGQDVWREFMRRGELGSNEDEDDELADPE